MDRKMELPSALPLIQADPEYGLTSAQVLERQAAGLRNVTPCSNTRTLGQIVRENLLTFFNLIFLILGLALAFVGSFKNMMFLLVAFANAGIGIFQELRAKRAVDKLTLVAAGMLPVIRDGVAHALPTDQLVRDDIVIFAAGDQICADATLCAGELRVNEALLTGEADAIVKRPGDLLRSGSFVVGGRGKARLTQVGADSYAARLAAEAKQNVRSTRSEMMRALSRLITVVGILLIPLGALLFYRHYAPACQGLPLRESVEATVAALVGMIPEGLYLLTSIAIAASCLKLSRQRVLAQDMNCIETLARVDVLCVDKTGTITEPGMEVVELCPLDTERYPYEKIESILAAYYQGEEPENETARALIAQFGGEPSGWKALRRAPFSSETKWSAVDFGEHGCYLLGAPEFLLGERAAALPQTPPALQGCRRLLLAAYEGKLECALSQEEVSPIAAIYLSNPIRPDAAETFRYFTAQGVSIRVISGDAPETVSEVAARAGIPEAARCVDASLLKSEQDYRDAAERNTVFGRVTPEQKRQLIRAFRQAGHTVAMTGDGVNDVLALKESDCGIAMASGSQAASQIAQLVLLDSQFCALPGILGEGRRVINNIQRAAALFLVKNIFSFLFTLLSILLGIPYPLQSIQLTLVSSLTIGIPSFFLALEPNYALVEGKFLRNVIRRAMPGGLSNVTLVLLASWIVTALDLPDSTLNLLAVWIMATVGLLTLFQVSRPFTRLRAAVLIGVSVLLLLALLLLPGFFELPLPGWETAALLLALLLACPTVMRFYLLLFDRRMLRRAQKKREAA